MDSKRTTRFLVILAIVALAFVLVAVAGPKMFDALLAMHGL